MNVLILVDNYQRLEEFISRRHMLVRLSMEVKIEGIEHPFIMETWKTETSAENLTFFFANTNGFGLPEFVISELVNLGWVIMP